ncbi:MAG: hypothetical protein KDL87_18880 [Verrucomicrobiae bacterium]|nr:hypothetical protein [Verrucomicrobiae bacterium]
MKRLASFLKNPFDDPGISDTEMMAFVTDHLGRLKTRNGDGSWTSRIDPTQAAYDAFSASFTQDLSSYGWRKGSKFALRRYRKALPATLSRIMGSVVAEYGARSPEVRACLPEGSRALARCTDDTLGDRLGALLKAVTRHPGLGGDQTIAATQALVDGWKAVHQQSESATARKTATQSAKRQARRTLQRELFLNLLEVGLRHPGDPAKLSLYMQEHWLRDRRPRRKKAEATDPA